MRKKMPGRRHHQKILKKRGLKQKFNLCIIKTPVKGNIRIRTPSKKKGENSILLISSEGNGPTTPKIIPSGTRSLNFSNP
jgi:hypothetical protein